MSEDANHWRNISMSKVQLGLITSLLAAGIGVGVTFSAQLGRIDDLEQEIRSETREDIDSLYRRISVVEDGVDGLNQLRVSDLSQTPKSWTVEGLQDRVLTLELIIEDLTEEDE
jgi:hypothetical protein